MSSLFFMMGGNSETRPMPITDAYWINKEEEKEKEEKCRLEIEQLAQCMRSVVFRVSVRVPATGLVKMYLLVFNFEGVKRPTIGG